MEFHCMIDMHKPLWRIKRWCGKNDCIHQLVAIHFQELLLFFNPTIKADIISLSGNIILEIYGYQGCTSRIGASAGRSFHECFIVLLILQVSDRFE